MAETSFWTPLPGVRDQDARWLTDAEQHLGGVSSLIAKLQSAATSLPEVAPDGSSECPFAGELYAQKEELERRLLGAVASLRRHLEAVEEELQRCKEKLKVISQDKSQLAFDEAIDQYAQAEQKLRDKCTSLSEDRRALLDAIGRAVAALAASRSKKYPGKKPKGNSIDSRAAVPMGLPSPQPSLHVPYSGPALRPEPHRIPSPSIGALVRLGPMGNNGWHSPP